MSAEIELYFSIGHEAKWSPWRGEILKEAHTLCQLEKKGIIKKNLKYYKKLVRDGRFVCRRCGRVARGKRNLCRPTKL